MPEFKIPEILDTSLYDDREDIYQEPIEDPYSVLKAIADDITTPLEILAKAIIDSSIYKDAHDLFSSDLTYGAPYLTQLELIPYSTELPGETHWDRFVSDTLGFNSKFDKAYTDAFNTALDEIRSLVQNYYSFKNTLPEEQIEQQKAAGYNAAVTGQGVGASSVSSEGNVVPNTSMSTYTNQELNDGITNFVSFLSQVYGLVNTGVNAASVLGNLSIAKEAHDAALAKEGIVTSKSSLSGNKSVENIAKVASAFTSAEAAALDSTLNVPIGADADPDTPQTTIPLSGFQVLQELSKYSLLTRMGDSYVGHIRKSTELQYAQLNSTLEQEYLSKNYESLANEGQFTSDFYKARSGYTEGSAQTSIAESLKGIRDSEAQIAAFNAWIADFKERTFESWGAQLADNPSLAPYLYKGIFDFGMEDTFYHSSVGAMTLKYGLDNVGKAADIFGAFLRGFSGGKAPVKPRGRRTVSTSRGPKGTTTSETISEDIY